ncbi:40S ribosomal protein S2 [Microtus ochrogaster]|uniref:Small ribosomal subunit protein uS5 n=1 Tax=Microtus ochrogaster TaxID=79684 RepID=A0A8J6L359_MICOH|nr:40S ribosomal protein S2 [Microtus ochrogaster]
MADDAGAAGGPGGPGGPGLGGHGGFRGGFGSGLGVKCSKEVATAIRGDIILAKLSIVPVRRGYWGNKIGKPHTVQCKVTGRCGSVLVSLIPAPRGTGIVSAPVPKKLLMMAGIDNCYTSARGCTATLDNFAKATFDAISKTTAT